MRPMPTQRPPALPGGDLPDDYAVLAFNARQHPAVGRKGKRVRRLNCPRPELLTSGPVVHSFFEGHRLATGREGETLAARPGELLLLPVAGPEQPLIDPVHAGKGQQLAFGVKSEPPDWLAGL